MKVLLRYKDRIEEIDIDLKYTPVDLYLTFTKPKKTAEVFALVGKAEGMPYYRFMRATGRP